MRQIQTPLIINYTYIKGYSRRFSSYRQGINYQVIFKGHGILTDALWGYLLNFSYEAIKY